MRPGGTRLNGPVTGTSVKVWITIVINTTWYYLQSKQDLRIPHFTLLKLLICFLAGLARIVNERHFERVKTLLGSTNGKTIFGGEADEKNLWISPAVVGTLL